MIIRVIGVAKNNIYNDLYQRNQTKFYQPQEKKQKVKQDFGLMLDAEMEKLKFDKIV